VGQLAQRTVEQSTFAPPCALVEPGVPDVPVPVPVDVPVFPVPLPAVTPGVLVSSGPVAVVCRVELQAQSARTARIPANLRALVMIPSFGLLQTLVAVL
jgi:hypothetical protein